MATESTQYTDELVMLDQLLPTEVVENTELDFYNKFDGFNALEVKLLNHENYTKEEIEQIKKILLEHNENLKNNFRGYNIRDTYPNEESFEPFDYTETKTRLQHLELVETDESDDEYDYIPPKQSVTYQN